MKHKIESVNPVEFGAIVELWEDSVRDTHHFLTEEDIQFFMPLILNTYLDAVELRCVRNSEREIMGFSGVADQNLEMLFVHPKFMAFGVGRALLNHAIDELGVIKVDVNEQNEQAVGFYHHCGFETVSRSELDGSGKPYPTLHMVLTK